jgi:hypothetical protein
MANNLRPKWVRTIFTIIAVLLIVIGVIVCFTTISPISDRIVGVPLLGLALGFGYWGSSKAKSDMVIIIFGIVILMSIIFAIVTMAGIMLVA